MSEETQEIPQIGTSVGIPKEVMEAARAQIEKMKLEDGISVPDRGDLTDPSHEWLYGTPGECPYIFCSFCIYKTITQYVYSD